MRDATGPNEIVPYRAVGGSVNCALELLPRRRQVTGQRPLPFAMVVYTYMGLYLLFGA